MVRPTRHRYIESTPSVTYFKPQGIPLRELDEVCLSCEGFESLRLAALEGLTSMEASAIMGVSRHTFGRILSAAQKAVVEALVTGKALRIEGGNYVVAPRHKVCSRESGEDLKAVRPRDSALE